MMKAEANRNSNSKNQDDDEQTFVYKSGASSNTKAGERKSATLCYNPENHSL